VSGFRNSIADCGFWISDFLKKSKEERIDKGVKGLRD
jgi:hypothetical protein